MTISALLFMVLGLDGTLETQGWLFQPSNESRLIEKLLTTTGL